MATLLLRADASTQIGTGHVMRCLALAQVWQESGGSAMLAAATLPQTLADRLVAEQVVTATISAEPGSSDDVRQTAALAHSSGAAWVVVDGYQFGADYQRALKEVGLRVLFIDDYGHAGSYCADLVLNQNLYAHEDLYANRAPQTRLLPGSRYVLLRREFWPWQGWQRKIAPVARKVLVTLGGADPDNVTLKVLQALNLVELANLEVVVIAGGGNPHHETLQAAALCSHHQIRVEQNVTYMPFLMAWADLAISAGGSTCYELAFMGVPALTIVLAKNQLPVATAFDQANITRDLGWYVALNSRTLTEALEPLLADHEARSVISKQAQSIIDGYGCFRVISILRSEPIYLRRATGQDCRQIWEWANEPTTRAASFSSAPISWEQHTTWFTTQITNPNQFIMIGEDISGVPVGQIRFSLSDEVAVISVSLDVRMRGMGYGSLMIRQGVDALFSQSKVLRIDAYVKPKNEASLHAFRRAGFNPEGTTMVHGYEAVHLSMRRMEGSV